MADLRDYTKKNPIFTGTDGIRLPSGNSAQRVASANVAGTMRYNTDIAGMELYTPTGWLPIAAPPSISTVSPSTYSGASGTEFTINGSNFTSDAQVYFVTSNGTSILASTVSYYSPVQVRATTPRAIKVEEEPISVRVVQQSGTVTKLDCIDAGGVPNWITTAGTLGSIFGANTVNVYVSATDPEGTAITYQISSGSLPSGLNFSTANGLIQGVASSVLANTTYNFTIKANDTVNNNTDRSFSYTVLNRAPVINTAAGSLGTIYSGNAASASISAYDPDGGSLTYSVSSGTLPVNSSLGSANGVITGTPVVVTTNTTYSFTITSTDQGSLTASNNYTYTVLNRPPLWNTAATLTSYNTDTFTPITVNAYDPDGGSITYSLTSGSVPSGLSFVTANATITGTPNDVSDNTTSTFTVTATDPGADANARTFSLTITPITDAQFSNTVLLIHGSANTVIKDESSSNFPLTVVGDARASNFSPLNTSWSTLFTKSNTDYIGLPNGSVAVGANDFSIECWLYPLDRNGASTMFGGNTDRSTAGGSSLTFTLTNSNGYIECTAWIGGSGVNLYSSAIPLNTWTHAVWCRTGGTMSLFVNGVRVATNGTLSTSAVNAGSSSNNPAIGANGTGSADNFNGYISNFRMIIGSGVYDATASTITVPTGPLTAVTNTRVLACQDNRFVDRSTNGYALSLGGSPKVVGFSPFAETDTSTGSMYFDGSGDYVTIPSATPLQLSTSTAFTIEAWIYPTVLNGDNGILGKRAGAGSGIEWQFFVKSNKQIVIWNGSTDYLSGSTISGVGAWSHVAVTWDLTTLRFFINGQLCSSTHTGISLGSAGSSVVTIGGNYPGGELFTGYISNLRLVKGTAVYTTSFVPPTAQLTTVANTSLLTLQNRQPHNNHSLIDESNNKFIITRSGNLSQGTFTPFSADPGKWSTYFGSYSSGNHLTCSPGSSVAFGTGDFTIECWAYWDADPGSSANPYIVDSRGDGGWAFSWNYNGAGGEQFNLSWADAGGTNRQATTPMPRNRWNHCAYVRSGTTGTIYLNGVSILSFTDSTNYSSNITTLYIGKRYSGNQSNPGYLSNLRIVKGTAVYTGNFTPPTSQLTAISGTSLLTLQDNNFKDNSTNNFGLTVGGTPSIRPFSPFAPNASYTTANTGGSLYFDGSGDFLDITDYANLTDLGGRPAHLEFWYYPTAAGTQVVLGKSGGTADWGSSGFEYQLQYVSGSFNFYWNASGTPTAISLARPINSWYHIVMASDASNNLALFVNGVRAGTGTNAVTKPSTRTLFRFGQDLSSNWATGIMSGLRFVSGNNAYSPLSSSISVPTIPPRNVANTVLLINGTGGAIIDSTGKNIIETAGNAKSNNSLSKFNGGSSYYDGDGDYLIMRPSEATSLDNSNFTWECWVYRNAVTDSTYADALCCSSAGVTGFAAGVDPSGLVGYAISASSGSWDIRLGVDPGNPKGSIAVPLRTWTHIALVRNGSTFTGYVNGQVDQTFTSSSAISNLGNLYFIGRWHDSNNRYWNGHIQEFRITRMARYTTTFTPPTRSFPNR